MMVEVFKTDIPDATAAAVLQELLVLQMPLCRISFDLDDCDKVLRVEGENVCNDKIISLLAGLGYNCHSLE